MSTFIFCISVLFSKKNKCSKAIKVIPTDSTLNARYSAAESTEMVLVTIRS